MLKQFLTLFRTLDHRQRRRLYLLQILIVVTALFELIGISSVAPFIAALADPSIVQTKPAFQIVYQYFGFTSTPNFIVFLGLAIVVVMTVGNSISLLTTYLTSKNGYDLGAELSNSIFNYYLNRDYLFHVYHNSSKLMSNIQGEVRRLTDFVIFRALYFNSRLFTILFIGMGLFFLDPVLTMTIGIVLTISFLIVFRILRRKLLQNGVAISENFQQREKILNEAFSGIKDVKILSREKAFLGEFQSAASRFSESQTLNEVLAIAPRYVLEVVAFGGFIFIALSLFLADSALSSSLPLLSVYAMGGFKLMPAVQQSFYAVAAIRGNWNAFENLKNDLIEAQGLLQKEAAQKVSMGRMDLNKEITLEQVTFRYPSSDKVIVSELDITIPKNTTVAFVGHSGSGKTTCVDVILGLLSPTEGKVKIDNQPLDNQNLRAWQANIGYVPQSVFLSDRSIGENIAFGVSEKEIDLDRVEKCAVLANIHDFVSNLKEGYRTPVGERGVQLSGGQRQRIGIARALYKEASVLVLDEATSSLDSPTEASIIEAINGLSHSRTIILVAHRLTTVKRADQIFLLDQGRLVDQGSYEELLGRNEKFRSLANA